MIFCSKQRILNTTEIPSVIINHMPIERVTCFTFIGVIIESNLTWYHHINYISNKLTRIYVGEIFDKCPIAENRFTSCLLLII